MNPLQALPTPGFPEEFPSCLAAPRLALPHRPASHGPPEHGAHRGTGEERCKDRPLMLAKWSDDLKKKKKKNSFSNVLMLNFDPSSQSKYPSMGILEFTFFSNYF